MDIDALLEKLGHASRVGLSPDELTGLLEATELLRKEDTCISGMIRIIHGDGVISVAHPEVSG